MTNYQQAYAAAIELQAFLNERSPQWITSEYQALTHHLNCMAEMEKLLAEMLEPSGQQFMLDLL
jgi:hypothetical protein